MSLSVQYVKYVVSKRENPVLMPEEWLNDWRLRLFQAAKPEKGDNRFYTHNNDVRLCMFGTPENFVQWNNMKSFVCLLRGDYKGTSGEVDVRFRPVEWRPKNLYTHTTIKEKSFLEKNSFTVLYQFEIKWQCAVLHTQTAREAT